MKRLLLVLTALLFTSAGVAFSQVTGTLAGTVVDSDGEPIPGVTVNVVGTNRGAYTGPDGSYTVPGLRAGTYDVRFSEPSYREETQTDVLISQGRTTELNITLVISGSVIEVTATRELRREQTGQVSITTGEEIINNTTSTTVLGAVTLSTSASGAGQNGIGVRGGRSSETSYRVDGLEVSDPIQGNLAGGAAGLFPTVSPLAVQEVQVYGSGFGAEYGDVISGVVNTVTRTGRSDRYEGALSYRMPIGALYGSSAPITVQLAGTDQDTVLPGYKLQSSESYAVDFGFGGPIPGVDDITFYLTGRYEPRTYTSAGYEVYDMSDEFAASRADLARQTWGFALEPFNLGHQDHDESLVRNLNAKLKYDLPLTFADGLSRGSFIEFGGELGLTRREISGWSRAYQLDHPVFTDTIDGMVVQDTNRSLLERHMQLLDQNTSINRLQARVQHFLTPQSWIELTGGYVLNSSETGEKDESLDYGPLDQFAIYRPIDSLSLRDNNVIVGSPNAAVDRYEMSTGDRQLNPFLLQSINLRNPLTGLYERGEAPGASLNPYGLNDLNFSTHGNERVIELRESQTVSFKGNYQNQLDLGDVATRIKAGVDLDFYTLRRNYNSLPWDQAPFFDVYGYDATYFASKDTTGRLREFLIQPYTPMKGAVYLDSRFTYESIVFNPGIRFDFFDPNTQRAPIYRDNLQALLDAVDSLGDASMKFQVSPRVGVSYPVTESSLFRMNFAMMFRTPNLNLLYDNAYGDAQRGNQLFGNPDIEPEKVIIYDLGYESNFLDFYNVNVSAYYRDIYNQSGVTYVPALPSPYILYTVQEYGNVRGLEFSLSRNLVDNIGARLNYTLQRAAGTASSPTANYSILIGAPDPYTGEQRTRPLTEFPLSYDQTHRLTAILNVAFANDEGPSLGGIHLFENTNLTLQGEFGSGLPYTRVNTRGEQIGEYNEERFPSVFEMEAQLQRTFMLKDIFGDGLGNTSITIYALVYNLLNNTDPTSVFTTTGSPDNNGTSLDRGLGEFVATPYYAEVVDGRPETYSAQQYDQFGTRFYNPYVDENYDGVVTQLEKYRGYQRFVATYQSLRVNYNAPRTVHLGVRLRF